MRVPLRLLVIGMGLGSILLAGVGRAATRAFGETYETRTGSQGDAQIESWVDYEDASFGGPNWEVWRVWWGGTASITDALEVSFYVTAAEQRGGPGGASADASSGLELEKALLMGRYRLLGDGAHGFSLMLQLELGIPMLPSVADQLAFNYLDHATDLGQRVIASYDFSHFLIAANLFVDETMLASSSTSSGYDFSVFAKYAAGVAYAPFEAGVHGPPFTVGVEVFGDIPLGQMPTSAAPALLPGGFPGASSVWWPGRFPVALGPSLSFASGRFWATASFGYAPGGAYVDPEYRPAAPRWSSNEAVGRLIVAFEF